MDRKKSKTRAIQSFIVKNEKDIIQIILAAVLIIYMVVYRFVS